MENFVFQNETKIVFGKGVESETGKETAQFARKILLHYGSKSIKASGLHDKVVKSLKAAGVELTELPGVVPNPRLSLVREGIRICREKSINFILAVGGGSTIDSSKAIAIGVPYSGDVWDFYTGKAQPREMLPVGVVLTIPAAGSEASSGSVITDEKTEYKRSCDNSIMRPKFAIMNPELTYTLPAWQTACGAADIMAHVMERYFSRVKATDLTDRLCEATLKAMIRNAPMALADPKNYDTRAEIMWAGTIAHNDLVGTGRAADWGSHMVEHELSAIYDVAHGAGLAVVFPAWMRHVYKLDLERFVQFAVRVWDVEYDFASPERTALEGIRRMKEFFTRLGLPTTLKELGVKDDKRFDEMAKKCVQFGPVGNFKKLAHEDVVSVLKLAV